MSVKISETEIINASKDDFVPVPMDSVRRREILENLGFSMFDTNGEAQAYRGILLTEIKRVFEKYQNRDHWKLGFTAFALPEEVSALIAGIEYYHGAQAEIVNSGWETVTIKSMGYQT